MLLVCDISGDEGDIDVDTDVDCGGGTGTDVGDVVLMMALMVV